jgi:hypothetical protein
MNMGIIRANLREALLPGQERVPCFPTKALTFQLGKGLAALLFFIVVLIRENTSIFTYRI